MNPQGDDDDSTPIRTSINTEPTETAGFLSDEEMPKINDKPLTSLADGNKHAQRKRDYLLHPIQSFRQWRAAKKAKLLSKERHIRTSSDFEFRFSLVIDQVLALIALCFITLGTAAFDGHDKTREQKSWLSELPTAMKYASKNSNIWH